jgi:hypothetical protein
MNNKEKLFKIARRDRQDLWDKLEIRRVMFKETGLLTDPLVQKYLDAMVNSYTEIREFEVELENELPESSRQGM